MALERSNPNDYKTIPFNQIYLGKQIGEGGSGYVIEGTWCKKVGIWDDMLVGNWKEVGNSILKWNCLKVREEEIPIAVKKAQFFPELFDTFLGYEAKILSQLDSPYVVKLYGVADNQLIMEYMTGGSFKKALEKQKLNEGQLKNILLETAKGLDYLHSHNVTHGDIKPDNILLDENQYHAKLCDFEHAKQKEASDPAFLSSSKADIRDLGVVFERTRIIIFLTKHMQIHFNTLACGVKIKKTHQQLINW